MTFKQAVAAVHESPDAAALVKAAAEQRFAPAAPDVAKVLRAGKPETAEERAARLAGTFRTSAQEHSSAPAPIPQSEQNDRVRQLNKRG